MNSYKRYDRETIESIGVGLTQYNSASELAKALNIDVSGLIKHIKKYRCFKESSGRNKCGIKNSCHIVGFCEKKPCMKYRKDPKECKYCSTINCNQSCPLFTPLPKCERLNKFPYTCDGCTNILGCHISHYFYDVETIWKNIQKERSSSRVGCHADEKEFVRLSNLLVPLIKEKHQSLPQIFQTHKDEIRWSYPTVLKFIDLGLIPNLANIDLTKRVRYPKSYKKNKNELTNFAVLNGRTYDDFVSFITEHPGIEVVEMDTVLSCRNVDACLLTLLFRKSNFMLAFLLKEKTTKEVMKAFQWIKDQLGIELYRKAFACVLTDNGSEFADPKIIEFDYETGEKVCHLFYCDPGKSGQKGKIEKNHVELRKVFPKGCDFSIFTQRQINIALSHINSEPRAILNGNCPGVIAKVFLNEKIPALTGYSFVDADLVNLHPTLLK